jgi:hypothetical protein
MCNCNSFLGRKAVGREADCSPSSSAKIKNAWSCISNPYMRPGVCSRNSICTADITVHGTVFISPQNRITEMVRGRADFHDTLREFLLKTCRENLSWFKIEQQQPALYTNLFITILVTNATMAAVDINR